MAQDTMKSPSHVVLPFKSHHLDWLGSPEVFMNPSETMEWIDSVSPFLQDWYDHCLALPEAAEHIKATRSGVDSFVRGIMEGCDISHFVARKQGQLACCPSYDLLHSKAIGSSDFALYTVVTACLIARYGIRCGAFKSCMDESGWHLAAVMLLVSVIDDLESGDYFATLFKRNSSDNAVTQLERELNGLTMDACSAPATAESDAQIEAMQHKISTMKLKN